MNKPIGARQLDFRQPVADTASMTNTTTRPNMTATTTLRMLGDNVTLMRCAWLELLDELRSDSTLAQRIRAMLDA